MVINSTNINKTKNHLSSEPNSLNTKKRPRHMTLEIQILVWNKHNNVTGLSRLMEYQPYSLDNWISNDKTYINKQFKKNCTDSLQLKKTTYYRNSEWQYTYGQYNGRVNGSYMYVHKYNYKRNVKLWSLVISGVWN